MGTKRQVIVERHDSGVLWGIKIQGGRDFGQKLRITEINKDGVVAAHGLLTGSEIVSINGEPTASMTHHQAQEAIIRCGNRLQLEIIEPSFSEQPTPVTEPSRKHYSLDYASEAQPYRCPRGKSGSVAAMSVPTEPLPQSTLSPAAEPISETDLKTTHFTSNLAWNPQTQTMTLPSYSMQPYNSNPEGPKAFSTNDPHPKQTPFHSPDIHKTVPAQIAETVRLNQLNQNLSSRQTVYAASSSPIKTETYRIDYDSPSVNYSSGDERTASVPRTVPGTAIKRPVCFSCHREIHGPFVDTGSLCFCPQHFKCEQCEMPLAEQQYSESNGKFYCARDFVQLVAPRCAKCYQPVVGLTIKALGKPWHPQCFVCSHCHKQLRDVFHVEDTGEVLCREHWEQIHLKPCASCKKPISEIDRFIEVFGKCFHAQCFCCAACRTPLEGKMFHPRDGKAFCPVHANAQALYS